MRMLAASPLFTVSGLWLLIIGHRSSAVLAVFEQMKVNADLHNLVSGEAFLNDAAGLTLYGFFVQLGNSVGESEFPPVDVAWAFLQFLVICVGGCAIGILLGLLGALESRFTQRSGALEPLIVLSHGLVAYMLAYWIGMSAIIALFSCALVMSFFVDRNAREGSRVGIRALLFILGQMSETVVFLYVGASTLLVLVTHAHSIDGALIGITFALCRCLPFQHDREYCSPTFTTDPSKRFVCAGIRRAPWAHCICFGACSSGANSRKVSARRPSTQPRSPAGQ
jgi:hypothetical protein